MRRWASILLLALVLAVTAAVAGCEYGSGDTDTTRATSDDPQVLAQAVIDAGEELKSFTCTFEMDMQAKVDLEEAPSSDLPFIGMLQKPVTLSGTLSFDEDTQAMQVDLTVGGAGMTYNMGMRVVGEKAWLSMFGQWYDFAPAIAESQDDYSGAELDTQALKDRMVELKVEPLGWLGTIELAGHENLEDTAVYHLASTPDLDQLIADILVLMRDEKFLAAIDPSGELPDMLAQDAPTASDFRDLRSMISDFTLDLWAGNADNLVRQVSLALRLAPPPGEPTEGVENVDLVLELKFDDLNQPVKVKAPDSFLPYEMLEELMGGGSSDFPMPITDDPSWDSPSWN